MIRLTLILLALAVVQPAFSPVAVRAATAADCSTYVDTLAKDLQTNTTMVDDLARPNHPTPDHIVQSAAGYNNYVKDSELCPPAKKAYVDALLTTWKAWLDYATTHADPTDITQLAARKLQQCTVTYKGTDDGATCATWEQQITKWQTEWDSP